MHNPVLAVIGVKKAVIMLIVEQLMLPDTFSLQHRAHDCIQMLQSCTKSCHQRARACSSLLMTLSGCRSIPEIDVNTFRSAVFCLAARMADSGLGLGLTQLLLCLLHFPASHRCSLRSITGAIIETCTSHDKLLAKTLFKKPLWRRDDLQASFCWSMYDLICNTTSFARHQVACWRHLPLAFDDRQQSVMMCAGNRHPNLRALPDLIVPCRDLWSGNC